MPYAYFIVFILIMAGMMLWQSRTTKKQQAQRNSFMENLKPGSLVITIGGIIGTVVSVDTEYEEIVIDSEGSLLRFAFKSISREYTRPAFVHDDEVDEQGNPLPIESASQESAQESFENGAAAEQAQNATEDDETIIAQSMTDTASQQID